MTLRQAYNMLLRHKTSSPKNHREFDKEIVLGVMPESPGITFTSLKKGERYQRDIAIAKIEQRLTRVRKSQHRETLDRDPRMYNDLSDLFFDGESFCVLH
ncbi:Hypothetical predicted protein [Mytilus galloprovincialis]|uniref:Uncharacterized protein n=1 Tax=Mytilus galloprovincialis TaxID=29158 RepID=A0A8B6BZB8_MYTGA|nr:Hypothetical predicted protein [Mytilus galloprovincialis]